MTALHTFSALRPILAAPGAWITRQRNYSYASSRSSHLVLTRIALTFQKIYAMGSL